MTTNKTTAYEMLIESILVGKTLILEDDSEFTITHINHTPFTNYVFISNGIQESKLFLHDVIKVKNLNNKKINPTNKIPRIKEKW